MKKSLLLLLLFTLAFSNAFSQWSQLNKGLFFAPYSGVIIKDSTIITLGGNDMIISNDLGHTWQQHGSGLQYMAMNLSMNDKAMYAYGGTNLFYSTDFGDSWNMKSMPGERSLGFGITDKYVYFLTQMDNENFQNLYRSGDNGESWQKVNLNSILGYGAKITDGKNLFIIGSSNGKYGLLMSTDDGGTWESIYKDIGQAYIRCIYKDGNDIFAGLSYNLFHSSDNGQTWQISENGMTDTIITSLAHEGNVIFAGSVYGKLYKSTDNGSSWQKVSYRFPEPTVQDYGYMISNITIKGPTVILSNGYMSDDYGQTWRCISKGSKGAKTILIDKGDIFAGTDGGGVYRSTDGGMSWKLASEGLDYQSYLGLRITSLAAVDDAIFAATFIGLYISSNRGESWQISGLNDIHVNILATYDSALYAGSDKDGLFVSYNKGQSWSPLGSMTDVRAIVKKGDKFWVGTYGDGVFLSTDNGVHWSDASIGLTNSFVMSLDADENTCYAGTKTGIFASSDNGNSWKLVCSNGGTNSIKDVAPYIYTATTDGVFISTNNGGSWKLYNKGIETTWSNDYILADNEDLYLAGYYWIFKTNIIKLIYSDVNEESAEKEEFNISPSVSSGFFNFSFDRAAGQGALLTISDPTGKVLKNIDLLPGQQNIQLDLSELSPGVYFSTFFNGRFNSTRKLVVIK